MVETNKIYEGDALEILKTLERESINCVVTSPPYWALRDYRVEGQLGLEPTFYLYISHLCDIFDEVKRVLRKDGTCWVNLGDTYGTKSGSGFANDNLNPLTKEQIAEGTGIFKANELRGTSPEMHKNLCNIPARFSIEMQNRGWILRNVIIWHKPNCMPCSVKDRFTVDFEYLFFFVKSKKYWFETQYEPHKLDSIKRACRARTSDKLDSNQYSTSYKQKNSGYDNMMERLENGEIRGVGANGRNKRTVWTISTKPFKGSHFAVYPPELIEIPIKSGCPEFVCNKCGKAREKIIERIGKSSSTFSKELNINKSKFNSEQGQKQNMRVPEEAFKRTILDKGYTNCGCNDYYCSNCERFINLKNIEIYAIQKQCKKENICSELGKEEIQEIEISRKKDRRNIIIQREGMSNMWKEILCKKDANVLFKEMWSKMASQEGESQQLESEERQKSSMERGEKENKWIHLSMESISPKGNERRICNGTQISNGETFEKIVGKERECSPHEWNEDRQQNREFGISDSQQSLWGSYLSTLSKEFQSEIRCPFCLSENIILKSSGFSGGIVLDPFFGAGTTGLVALKQNKSFIGIELNPDYIEIAKKRLKPFLEQKTIF